MLRNNDNRVMKTLIGVALYICVLIVLVVIVYWMNARNIAPGVMPQIVGFVAVVAPFVIYFYLQDKEI